MMIQMDPAKLEIDSGIASPGTKCTVKYKIHGVAAAAPATIVSKAIFSWCPTANATVRMNEEIGSSTKKATEKRK